MALTDRAGALVHAFLHVLSLPAFGLHELAHMAASLPWGGPAALYSIHSGEELRPSGYAVLHRPVDGLPNAFIAFAPLVYLLPFMLLYGETVRVWPTGVVVMYMFVAAIGTAGDILSYFDIVDFGDDIEDPRFVRLIDFTRFGLGSPMRPPATARSEEEVLARGP